MKRSGFKRPTYETALARRIASQQRRREKASQSASGNRFASESLNTLQSKPLQWRSRLKLRSNTFDLKNSVWKEFSIFIRRRDAVDGFVCCVTCWIEIPWKEAHAGHFVAGRGNSIIFDERNAHPQCQRCNITLCGNPVAYEEFMLKRYGQKVIDELRAQRDQTRKWQADELSDLLTHYRARNKGIVSHVSL